FLAGEDYHPRAGGPGHDIQLLEHRQLQLNSRVCHRRCKMAVDKTRQAKEGVEAFSAGDWERFKAPLSSDAVYEELGTQRRVQGPDAIVELSKGWRKAFPDAKGTITKAIESADTVVLEIIWEGTQTGELVGAQGSIPPTRKRVRIPAVQVVSFKGDKVAETKHYFDQMTMLAQLGVLPAPVTA